MKTRRSFLASIAALIAAPFVAKKASGYQVACDPVPFPKPDFKAWSDKFSKFERMGP